MLCCKQKRSSPYQFNELPLEISLPWTLPIAYCCLINNLEGFSLETFVVHRSSIGIIPSGFTPEKKNRSDPQRLAKYLQHRKVFVGDKIIVVDTGGAGNTINAVHHTAELVSFPGQIEGALLGFSNPDNVSVPVFSIKNPSPYSNVQQLPGHWANVMEESDVDADGTGVLIRIRNSAFQRSQFVKAVHLDADAGYRIEYYEPLSLEEQVNYKATLRGIYDGLVAGE